MTGVGVPRNRVPMLWKHLGTSTQGLSMPGNPLGASTTWGFHASYTGKPVLVPYGHRGLFRRQYIEPYLRVTVVI